MNANVCLTERWQSIGEKCCNMLGCIGTYNVCGFKLIVAHNKDVCAIYKNNNNNNKQNSYIQAVTTTLNSWNIREESARVNHCIRRHRGRCRRLMHTDRPFNSKSICSNRGPQNEFSLQYCTCRRCMRPCVDVCVCVRLTLIDKWASCLYLFTLVCVFV